ncbi:MAG TPA: protease modulator HflC [Gemmataceae bacterium]|jgi:membrane protease subunit HflC|nr:protease modulator HflC [Gemmataceae bacterium]
MAKKLLITTAALIAVLLLSSSAFSVDRSEYVYVTQFGKPVATYDGITEGGLHFKMPWPIQSVQRLDHRLQVFDLPGAELLTRDPNQRTIDKPLTTSAYVCWRIPDKEGVDRFIRAIGTAERAESILGQEIGSRLGAEIGNMRLEDLISIVPAPKAEERMSKLSQRLLDHIRTDEEGAERLSLREKARRSYGIELVDIRLRRFNYPPQVRGAIFDRIRSERMRKVADYQNEGTKKAKEILSAAEYKERTILADAHAKEQRVKGQAEADADRIRNQAQSKDVEFYAFLKKLAEYQRILGDNKTVLLLSSNRDLFDLLFKPPPPNSGGIMPRPEGNRIISKEPGKGGDR